MFAKVRSVSSVVSRGAYAQGGYPGARAVAVGSIALPVLGFILWIFGIVPASPALAALGVAAGATLLLSAAVAEAPRLGAGLGGTRVDRTPLPPRTRVLIVGAGESARRAAREMESGGEHEIVGFVTDDRTSGSDAVGVLGGTEEIPRLVRLLNVQRVVVAEAPAWQQQLSRIGTDSRSAVDVHVVPGLYEARVGRLRVHRVRDLPLVDLAPARPSSTAMTVKRACDLVVASIGLIASWPLMLAAAAAIKLTSPGPAVFRQERVGKGGRRFTIYKLRTMVADAEKHTGAVLSAGKSDARITPVGRFLRASRLDELPQLFNVLRGEMSIVGPRPERPCFVEQFEQEIPGYRERHQVAPGLTGLAQVSGGYAIEAELKLRYDLLYVYNCSLFFDLKIMLQTLVTMCRRTGH
jgi:exopolysaccharide biosynthesis polyprenyl glycosylphosphotransferase